MRRNRKGLGWLVLAMSLVSFGCRLTSPTPASWSGTPTAEARAATSTAMALTITRTPDDEDKVSYLPTLPEYDRSPTPTLQESTPEPPQQGPWMVYLEPDSGRLNIYDANDGTTLEVNLPWQVYTPDLDQALSPSQNTLALKAGSPLNTDELALYLIDLPGGEINKISALLSINLQREIVNEERERAFETLDIVTRPDSLAWSPDGRFLAFTAALDNVSSDLYVYDRLNYRIERLNGLYSHNASPFWPPGSNWLISQELNLVDDGQWRAESVTGLRVPGYDDQNTLYIPAASSQGEVFVGWINAQSFISYSTTAEGAAALREVNLDSLESNFLFEGAFDRVGFDPQRRSLVLILGETAAETQGMRPGVYALTPESAVFALVRAGDWYDLAATSGGLFVVNGLQGVFVFDPQGEGFFLANEHNARFSPSGNWLVAWGDGGLSSGARLYQPPSSTPLQTLIESPVQSDSWQPDSKGFVILSEGKLYHLAFPGLDLIEIADNLPQDSALEALWIE